MKRRSQKQKRENSSHRLPVNLTQEQNNTLGGLDAPQSISWLDQHHFHLFPAHCFLGVMSVIGRSQWLTRISNRRCSSFWYVAWSGQSSFFIASSSGLDVVAMVEFLKRMVTR